MLDSGQRAVPAALQFHQNHAEFKRQQMLKSNSQSSGLHGGLSGTQYSDHVILDMPPTGIENTDGNGYSPLIWAAILFTLLIVGLLVRASLKSDDGKRGGIVKTLMGGGGGESFIPFMQEEKSCCSRWKYPIIISALTAIGGAVGSYLWYTSDTKTSSSEVDVSGESESDNSAVWIGGGLASLVAAAGALRYFGLLPSGIPFIGKSTGKESSRSIGPASSSGTSNLTNELAHEEQSALQVNAAKEDLEKQLNEVKEQASEKERATTELVTKLQEGIKNATGADEVKALEKQLKEVQTESKNAQKAAEEKEATLNRQLKENSKDRQEADDHIAELSRQVEKEKAERSALEETLKAAEQARDDAAKEAANGSKAEIAALKKKFDDKQKAWEIAKTAIDTKAKAEIKAAKQTAAVAEAAKQEANRKLTDLKKRHIHQTRETTKLKAQATSANTLKGHVKFMDFFFYYVLQIYGGILSVYLMLLALGYGFGFFEEFPFTGFTVLTSIVAVGVFLFLWSWILGFDTVGQITKNKGCRDATLSSNVDPSLSIKNGFWSRLKALKDGWKGWCVLATGCFYAYKIPFKGVNEFFPWLFGLLMLTTWVAKCLRVEQYKDTPWCPCCGCT